MTEKNSNVVERSSYYWEDEPIVDKKPPINTKKYKLVDLFCGAGGISKGFHMSNKFETILAADIFIPAMETFKHNNPKTSTILGDIRKIKDETYLELLNGVDVDIVSAGVPCQGFSISNKKRNVDDERNFLFLEVIRFVNLIKPKIVLIENVSGMKSLNKGSFVDAICDSLENAGDGYEVQCQFVNAADYGVPQNRKRLIFVAQRKDEFEKSFQFPLPKFGEGTKKPFNTVRDALSDLPLIEANEKTEEYNLSPQNDYQKLMRKSSKKLHNHKAPNHPESVIEKIKNTEPGKPLYEKFKQRIRLSYDMLSPTQLAGGIRPSFQFGHPEAARGLTIRERARLQSFPDDYEFLGGTVQGRVQTGNAVPPLLAKAIGEEISIVLNTKKTTK